MNTSFLNKIHLSLGDPSSCVCTSSNKDRCILGDGCILSHRISSKTASFKSSNNVFCPNFQKAVIMNILGDN